MRINVEFYDIFRELAGRQEWITEIPEASTVQSLWLTAKHNFPALDRFPREPVFTSGLDYVELSHCVRDGETISILPAPPQV